MTITPDKQRKARERERKRAAGLRPGEVWAHPADWPKVRQYVARLTKKRLPRQSSGSES